MQRFKKGLLALIESVIFLTGSFIMISVLGFILAISFKNSLVPYLILSCWSIAGFIVLGALAKALWEGKRLIEIFDSNDNNKDSSGIASV